MGIQDRDYYRNEGPSVLDSLMPSGVVCRWLIGINVVVWVLQMVALNAAPPNREIAISGWVTDWFILDVSAVLHGQVWRLLTYAFLHDTNIASFHLLFNMLFLWWFGSDVEQLYRPKEFLAIYLTSCVTGGIAYVAWGVAMGHANPCLGASGAVTTMLILCALHYPRRIIYIFFMFPMPIWLFALFNVAQDTLIFVGGMRTGVAVVVHLAGAVFAVAYYKWQGRLTDLFDGFPWWRKLRSRPRLKLYRPESDKEEPVAVSALATPSNTVDEHLEAKLDAVLEKIHQYGKGSLTQQEEEILKRASEIYKRRRT